jgi:hypothetical protein
MNERTVWKMQKDKQIPIYLLLVLPLPRLPAVSHLASEAVV